MTDNRELEQALKGIDERKRRTLVRLGLGAAFVAPIVASFSTGWSDNLQGPRGIHQRLRGVRTLQFTIVCCFHMSAASCLALCHFRARRLGTRRVRASTCMVRRR